MGLWSRQLVSIGNCVRVAAIPGQSHGMGSRRVALAPGLGSAGRLARLAGLIRLAGLARLVRLDLLVGLVFLAGLAYLTGLAGRSRHRSRFRRAPVRLWTRLCGSRPCWATLAADGAIRQADVCMVEWCMFGMPYR